LGSSAASGTARCRPDLSGTEYADVKALLIGHIDLITAD
jgi:hypothetical protein